MARGNLEILLANQQNKLGLTKAGYEMGMQRPQDQSFIGATRDAIAVSNNAKSPWGAALQGFMAGLGRGQEGVNSKKQQEIHDKLAATFQSLEQTQASIDQSIMAAQQEQERIARINPIASSAYQVLTSEGSFQQKDNAMRSLYSQMTQVDPTLKSMSYGGYVEGTTNIIMSDKEGNSQIIDVKNFLTNDQIKNSIAEKNMEFNQNYKKELIEQKVKDRAVRERDIEVKEDKNVRALEAKVFDEYLPEYQSIKSYNKELDMMAQIANRSPKIFGTLAGIKFEELQKEGGLKNFVLSKLSRRNMTEQEKQDLETVSKITNSMVFNKIKGTSGLRPSVFLDQIIKSATPNIGMNQKTVLGLIQKEKEEVAKQDRLAADKIRRTGVAGIEDYLYDGTLVNGVDQEVSSPTKFDAQNGRIIMPRADGSVLEIPAVVFEKFKKGGGID